MLSQSHIRGLLQSLDFSEGTGTTLNDKSGNGNHATVVGGTWTADRFGRANRAILLDGTDDYIDLGLANYQGDISAVISAKIITIEDTDPILTKSNFSSGSYPPSFSLYLRTSNNALQTLHRYNSSGGTAAFGNLKNNAYALDRWDLFYVSARNAVCGSSGSNGSQSTTLNANILTNWGAGYPFLIGRNQPANVTRFANLAVDRIMTFNRFLSGHELSKIANRLKIGDMNK